MWRQRSLLSPGVSGAWIVRGGGAMAQSLRGSELGQSWSLPRLRSWSASAAFTLLAVIAAGCWLPLVWWYSLLANQANTHFAFEMIPGRFHSLILPATLLL